MGPQDNRSRVCPKTRAVYAHKLVQPQKCYKSTIASLLSKQQDICNELT